MEHPQTEYGAGHWSTEDVHLCHSRPEPVILEACRSHGHVSSHTPAGYEDERRLVRGGKNLLVPSPTLPRLPSSKTNVYKMARYRGARTTRADGLFGSMPDDSPRSPPEEVAGRTVDTYRNAHRNDWRGRSSRSVSPRRNNEPRYSKGRQDREREAARMQAQEEREPCDLETSEEKHQVLIEKYSGNNEPSKEKARLWVANFKARYGSYPMRVSLKVTRNTSGDLRERRGVKLVTCMVCMESLKTVQDASIHIVSKHMQLKGFQCSFCPSAYARQDDLKRHVKNSEKCSSMKAVSKAAERQQKEEWVPVAITGSHGRDSTCVPAMQGKPFGASPFFSGQADAISTHIHTQATASLPSLLEWGAPFSKQNLDYSLPPLISNPDIPSFTDHWPDDKAATHSANSFWACPTASGYQQPVSWR